MKNDQFTIDVLEYEGASNGNQELKKIFLAWKEKKLGTFLETFPYILQKDKTYYSLVDNFTKLPPNKILEIARMPGSVFWAQTVNYHKHGKLPETFDKEIINEDFSYLKDLYKMALSFCDTHVMIHENDKWLRCLFGKEVIFESENDIISTGKERVQEAFKILKEYNFFLYQEFQMISPVIQFVRDPLHLDKSFSFTENSVPGALYISIRKGEQFLDAFDVADAIIHEHRHHKLAMLESFCPIVQPNSLRVPSPWREDLRPICGLFHASFVFSELQQYWYYIFKSSNNKKIIERSLDEVRYIYTQLTQAFDTLKKSPLTPVGQIILERMISRILRL